MGLGICCVRIAGHDFSPGALALGRLLSRVAVWVLISLSRRAGWPPRAACRFPSPSAVVVCLLAASWAAVAVVSQEPALLHASALQVSTLGCAVGAVACLPFIFQLVSSCEQRR
jgi:hypothetical protein